MARSSRPRGRPIRPASPPGFSLIELLVAMALGALLLTGLANVARVFDESVREVRDEDDRGLEEALVGITDAVRTAWLVERPSASRLELVDALGRRTAYEKQGARLVVTRPSGATGVVLGNLATVAFDAGTTRRHAEAAPHVRYETLWSVPPPVGTPTSVTVHGGEELAVGFSLPTAAPAALHAVAGVEEQVLDASLDRLVVALSYFDGSPPEFCHLHASGPPHTPSHTSGSSSLAVDLHESRVPGDARPYGVSLASVAVPTPALPAASYQWIDVNTSLGVTPPEIIDPPAGVAWGWWDANPQVVLEVTSAPSLDIPVDLVPMSRTIEPGRGHALVLRVAGVDHVAVEAYPLPSTAGSNVAFRASGSPDFVPLPLVVPFRVEGLRRCTQTTPHYVISRVTVTLALQDGRRVSGSAVVAAQSAVADAWSGPVPGSLPDLLLAGQ
ncbi:MAG TPA: prepilin-type N-terminal cleavage/methylation domain-containing protein [Planctomycetota bacterium]|nr:prepilin-type N-terminal cleavage/methylation domain-containing protein [Planctomycetota bacterium]